MSKKVDTYLANLGILNIKFHNLHWNVIGLGFKQVHEYIEGIYDDISEKLDEVAEIQKMQNETPKASLKDYLKLTTIEELVSKTYSTLEAIEIISKDIELMRKLALDIRTEASKKDNFQLSNMMEDHVAGYDKYLWFMGSMLK